MKPMRTREVLKALRRQGCTLIRNNGRHDIYGCPCGKHEASVPTSHLEITAGVIRNIINDLECLPKGWLQ